MAKAPKSGLSVGENKGHQVTVRERRPRQSNKKGVSILYR